MLRISEGGLKGSTEASEVQLTKIESIYNVEVLVYNQMR